MNEEFENILDHYKNPRNAGKLVDYNNSSHTYNSSCGDSVHMYIRTTEDQLSAIGYEAEGCSICIASTSILSEYFLSKTIKELKDFSENDLYELLGIELTLSRKKCALLSLESMKAALNIKTDNIVKQSR